MIEDDLFIFFSDTSAYMCYYCVRAASDTVEIIRHLCKHHESIQGQLSLRVKGLDHNDGHMLYRSVHFAILIGDLKSKLEQGFMPQVDIVNKTLSFKRVDRRPNQIIK